jgi:hypothetical protein
MGVEKHPSLLKKLASKNVWSIIDGEEPWSRVVKAKYFPNESIIEWIRRPLKKNPKWIHHMEGFSKCLPSHWEVANLESWIWNKCS